MRKYQAIPFAVAFILNCLIPTLTHSYTSQDVQNYLSAHPAPANCYNWTEEYTSNGQTGVKVLKRCGGSTLDAYVQREFFGGYTAQIVGVNNSGTLVSQCAGGYGYYYWPQVNETFYTGYTQDKVTIIYCDGSTQVSYYNDGYGFPGKNPGYCLHQYETRHDCTQLDTLLKLFFPITNCTDADYDGFYVYNATSCTTGNDCDDGNLKINPNTVWYKDIDSDGYTDGTTQGPRCQRPAGYKLSTELQSATLTDCDDNDSSKNPQHPCCDLKITSFTGSNALLDPSSGGAVQLQGDISDTSGKAISWTVTIAGRTYEGSGPSVIVVWDGQDSDGKVVDPGPHTATLQARMDNECEDAKTVDFKALPPLPNICGLYVQFGSSANMASGNLSHSQDLFNTKGSGLSANMNLYYNSQDSHNTSLGMGWSHSYDITVKTNSDGSVVFGDGNGKKKLYEYSSGVYTSQPGDYSTLTKNPDGTFTIIHKDGTRYEFNAHEKISAIRDRNGNAITFIYSTDGDLTTITDSVGRTTSLTYDANHKITTISGPNGNTHTFTYTNNDLVEVKTQQGGSQSTPTNWSYTYYENSFIQSKTDPNGYTTTYTYDGNHRVAGSTDPEGKTRSITYPSPDDTSQSKTTTFTEKDGGNWTYAYDTQAGTLTQKTDPENGTTSYIYDANRNMTSKTEPDGSVTSYMYDASGNMTSTTDALNQTTTYTYNSYGQVTSITAPDGTTTTYEYNTSGNLTKTTDSTGASISYQYDSKGNVTQITNTQGQTTKFTYDQNNNLASVTDPTGANTTFTYDTAGNMTSQTDASGNTTRFEYNSLGRLIKVIDPSGNSTNSTYDNNGNKTSETDANGNVTYYEYNYKGQLIKVKDALGNVTTYIYGGTGCSSCGSGTDKLTVITDANGNSTKYEYDRLGRLTTETDPLGNGISYSYDSKGNLTSKTDANGATVSYSYDGLGRLLKKTSPDNTTETFSYDAKGNILTATNANTSYTFTYSTSGKVANVADSIGRTVSYSYDSLGNKTKLIYPEGSTVTYSYDTVNRLKSIVNGGGKTYTFTYDSLGRRSKLALPNGTNANYAYDNSGRLTSLIHKTSSGSVITQYNYTHDKVGNRLSKTNTDVKNDYSYDAIYRLLHSLPTKLQGKDITQENKAENFSYDPVGNRLIGPESNDSYNYNTGNQLTSDRKHQYEYDKNGNLIKKTETGDDGEIKVWTYSYDYENRLNKVVEQEIDKTVTVSFKYDPFGRRLEKRVTTTPSPLAGEGGGEGETKTYTYVYDNEDIILEYLTKTEDGKAKTEATKYVHGPGIDEPLAIERKGEVYFYHADGLGSITALTDKKQKVVESYTYSAFGEVKRKGDKVKNTYTFTAREWDEEIGLIYVRARYLDPATGRWTSFDPLLHPANGLSKGRGCSQNMGHPTFKELMKKPQKLNPYNYVEANPVMLKDPTGLGTCGSGKNEPYVPDNYGFYNLTGPCENHDKCYGTCGSSKVMCDISLFGDILKECSKLTWDPINQVGCIEVAYMYYYAVTVGGYSAYKDAQKEACCK